MKICISFLLNSKLNFVISLLLLSFSTIEKANAQAPDWLWAKGIGGTSSDGGLSTAIDTLGNVYTTGFFYGTVDFDPGIGTFNLTSTGQSDIFVSKLDALGNFIWAKAMGGTYGVYGHSIALDVTGNVYTTGYFSGTVDFDPSALGIYNLTSAGDYEIFISKLDGSGDFVWAKRMGGPGDDEGYAISIDASGNVYTTGRFNGTANFDPGAGTFNLTSIGTDEIFVSKLDNSGNFLWANQMVGTVGFGSSGTSIAFDNFNNVYTSGYFYGTVDFDPGLDVFNLTSTLGDIFISKLDSSGNFVWAKGGTGGSSSYSIALDAFGSVYTTGYFKGEVDFDPDSSGTFYLTSSYGNSDIFIYKLDNSGNFVWAKAMGGTYGDIGLSIALDATNNVYTTGHFSGTADFDPGAGAFNLNTGNYGIFVSKLDNSGNFVWAKQTGGTSSGGMSIALDASENVYLAGSFGGTFITFDSITLINANDMAVMSDIFIAKLNNFVTGIENVEISNGISVYPNPANEQFTIELAGNYNKVKVTITDIAGKMVYSTTATTQKIEVNTENFAEGVYAVQIQTENYTETKKLIVVK